MSAKHWWEGRLAGFDLETTSPNPEEARVVTSAVVAVGAREPVNSFTQVVNPGVDIPEEAAAIHGVTNDIAQAKGAHAGTAIGELLDVLLALIEVGIPLFIFNGRYDLTVLDREARRWDMEPISEHPNLRVIDPRVIDSHIERYRPGSRILTATSDYWLPDGKKLAGDAAHDADADALTAVRLGYTMCSRGRVVRRARDQQEYDELQALTAEWEAIRFDLDAIHAAQVRWAEFQARGLEEHLARKGTPKLVDYVWPVVLPGQRREGTEGKGSGLPQSPAPVPAPPEEPVDIEAAKASLFESPARIPLD